VAESDADLIRDFYAAFARRDGDTMAAAYLPDARFEDPAFGELTGVEAGAMWRMLTSRAEDLEVRLASHQGSDGRGHANWIATYTFVATGRHVVNDIQASFRFRDGKIAEHVDDFPFHRWARQALGPPGLLLGWTPMLRAKVRNQAKQNLADFMAADSESAATTES
jgi:ketosteroid isomerase-like protein